MTAPFPFVVGCGRSGSTLLRVMLDAHPDLVIPPESYFLESMLRRRDGFALPGRFDRIAFVRELRADSRFRTWGIDLALVTEELDRDRPADLADAVRAVYRAAAGADGSIRYGDKTPGYALCVPQIASLLPESVFIHLVRDPRDVAASYHSASWGPRTFTSAGKMWADRAGAARTAGRRLGPRRYLEILYEDLVADPAAELQRVCDFIELSFDSAMLSYEDGAAARQTSGRDGGAHHGLLQRPRTGVRDWRLDLTVAQAARVGAVTDRLSSEFGYAASPHCVGVNRGRLAVERLESAFESLSLAFRRTRAANLARRPWRVLRGRATAEQVGAV